MEKRVFAYVYCISFLSAPVNADVCAAVVVALKTFLMGTIPELKSVLEKYNPPEAALSAPLQVKECVDELSNEDRHRILFTLVNSLFFLHRGICSVRCQEGGWHLLCEGTGGGGSCLPAHS